MATLTITLTDGLKARAEAQAAAAGFASVDEYLASLIGSDIAIPLDPALEAHLLAAKDSPGRVMSASDWELEKQGLRERFGK